MPCHEAAQEFLKKFQDYIIEGYDIAKSQKGLEQIRHYSSIMYEYFDKIEESDKSLTKFRSFIKNANIDDFLKALKPHLEGQIVLNPYMEHISAFWGQPFQNFIAFKPSANGAHAKCALFNEELKEFEIIELDNLATDLDCTTQSSNIITQTDQDTILRALHNKEYNVPTISNADKINLYFKNPERTKEEGFKIFGEIISCDHLSLCQYYLDEYKRENPANGGPVDLASFAMKNIKNIIYLGSIARITGVILQNIGSDYPDTVNLNHLNDKIKTSSQPGIGHDGLWEETRIKEYSEAHKIIAAQKIKKRFQKYKTTQSINEIVSDYFGKEGELEKLKNLLETPGIDINEQDGRGMTYIARAAANNKTEAVKLLLEKGANPNIPDNQSMDAVSWAQFNRAKSVASFFEEKGIFRWDMQKEARPESNISEELKQNVNAIRENLFGSEDRPIQAAKAVAPQKTVKDGGLFP